MAIAGTTTNDPRAALLADLPVRERRVDAAAVSTAVLEGGDGPPLVLLHGPGAYAAHWRQVIPGARARPPRDRARPAGPRAVRGAATACSTPPASSPGSTS